MPDERDQPADEEDEFGPGDPDFDLSEAHGYGWEPARERWRFPPWAVAGVSIMLVIALLLPALIIISHR